MKRKKYAVDYITDKTKLYKIISNTLYHYSLNIKSNWLDKPLNVV